MEFIKQAFGELNEFNMKCSRVLYDLKCDYTPSKFVYFIENLYCCHGHLTTLLVCQKWYALKPNEMFKLVGCS